MMKKFVWSVFVGGVFLSVLGCATVGESARAENTLTLLDEEIVLSDEFLPRREMTDRERTHYKTFFKSLITLVDSMQLEGCAECEQILKQRRKRAVALLADAHSLYVALPDDVAQIADEALVKIDDALFSIRNKPRVFRKRIIRFYVKQLPLRYTFAWPLSEFHISCEFGWRRHPITGRRQFHDGIDLAAERGTFVYAAAPGRVIFAGYRRRAGNTVIIEHPGGYRTFYAHLDEIFVAPGMTVSQGNPIGTVGATGLTTGPHLHFKVTKNGRMLNPRKIIGITVNAREE